MKLHSSYSYLITFSLLVLLPGIPGGTVSADTIADTNRLIIKFASSSHTGPAVRASASASVTELERLGEYAGVPLTGSHAVSDNSRVLFLAARVPLSEATRIAARLADNPAIEYAEPDRIKHPALVPTDTLFNQQWNLFEDAGGIRAPTAWDTEPGAPGIVIAVVDSGILAHDDLDPLRQVPGYDFISDLSIANDGNGRDGDPADPGDWVAFGECEPGSMAEDSSWHGTAVTGVIGAATDNAAGIAGVNIGSRLLMARALGKCGGYTSDIMEAARWAAGLSVPGVPDNANPARVINLSFSGQGVCTATEQSAINAINARGGVVVAAAGNQGVDVAGHSPANCSGVVTVAATSRSGSQASYTNYGNEVDLSAPGGDFDGIWTTKNTGLTMPAANDFIEVFGTSFATAHVSGVAGLVLSVNENLSSQQVRDILVTSARPFPDPSCTPSTCGSGIVDANAAVLLAAATTGQVDSDNDGVNDAVDVCLGTPAGEFVDAAGCGASQLVSGGGGGGGGCKHPRGTSVDPLLPALLVVAALSLVCGRGCPVRLNDGTRTIKKGG